MALSISSLSASKCPISSVFLCFPGLNITKKGASLFVGEHQFFSRSNLSKKLIFEQQYALNGPFYIKFLCYLMSNWFIVSLFLWSKYNNKECQFVSWLISIFLKEQFVKSMAFSQGDTLIPLSL